MRIFMTGGSGQIGKSTAEHLAKQGFEVRNFDAADARIAGVETVVGSILDFDALVQHMAGCDAVIHLAAHRSPFAVPGEVTFEVNVAGTFNVFEAAAKNGIRRVVQASSINALGVFYNLVDMDIRYFPVDEAHPTLTTDPYSFSKEVVEDIGAYYWRRDGISSVALRFPWVFAPAYAASDEFKQRTETVCRTVDELLALSPDERQERLATIHQHVMEFRAERPFEFRPPPREDPWGMMYADPLFGLYASDRFNLFACIDERDAAQVLEKGITASYEGAHTLFANSSQNWLGYDTMTLIRLLFPEITQFKSDLPGTATLVSIERARTLLGFEPEYAIPPRNTNQV